MTTRDISEDVTLKGMSGCMQGVIIKDDLPRSLMTVMAEPKETQEWSHLKDLTLKHNLVRAIEWIYLYALEN